nr:prolyl oligopeptidase family serine peptidase [Duganella guangzhouensis]
MLLAALCQQAVAAELPPAESFFRSPAISMVHLSPKGGAVALVMQEPDGRQTLVVRDSATPAQGHVVTTASKEEPIIAVHWINEQRIGLTVKNRQFEFESNYDEFAVDRNGEHFTHLIAGSLGHEQEKLGQIVKNKTLTSDYLYYAATHDGSDDILVAQLVWNHVDPAPQHNRLYRLNTRTRELRPAVEGTQPASSSHWVMDGSDTPRIVTSLVQGHCMTHYRQPGSDSWTEIANTPCPGATRWQPLFFDGADTLYVRASYQGYEALFRYNLQTRTLDKEPVLAIPGFDFDGHAELDWETKRLAGVHLQADAGTTVWFDPAMQAAQAKINAALPGAINQVHCAQGCASTPVLLVESGSDRKPTSYLLYNRASGTLVSLGNAHPDIDPKQMGLRDFHRYAARDGRQIPVYVTTPPGKASGPRPAVVLVHGGPYLRGGYWNWNAEAQFLASRGYLVIEPDFRGSAGYGYDHYHAGWKQWGLAMQDDLADAAQWAIKQGWADPKRVGIMGASYGGYATLMGLIEQPTLFRAGVEWAGVTDIGLMFTVARSDANRENRNYSMRTLIGDPEQDAAQLARTSPLQRAAELKQPLLMAHGGQDRRVPIEHASRFRDAAQRGNRNVTYLVYPDERHGWSHDDTNIDFWRQVDTFLDRNLKSAE